ncbi:Peptidoglycan-associated protein [Candidatus Xenohaliotis californiensis]|uniref:Peptidoglycan-associated lipoprotein n=1 Tax=Candidatus Xenohaliotis californiensis TaxID=84677 RepID=A0ABP0EYH7_9RICK|nr:Peptidoglycan-associated protein [Candidatus Xenohaliotis californiensis]
MKKILLLSLTLCLILSGCPGKPLRGKNTKHIKSDNYRSMYDDTHSHGKHKNPDAYIEKGSPEDFAITAGNRILFPHNSYQIKHEEQTILDHQIKWLSEYSEYEIILEGHCDERGTREYNIALGEKRANAIKNYMINAGIEQHRIKIASYGKDKPSVEGHNEEAWKLNRRVVINIS